MYWLQGIFVIGFNAFEGNAGIDRSIYSLRRERKPNVSHSIKANGARIPLTVLPNSIDELPILPEPH